MADVGVRLEGAARMRRTLKAAGGDLSDLKAAHRAAATTVATAARPAAPVLTGRLAGTIRASATNNAAVIRAGNNRRTATGTRYAGPIHWGWPAHNIDAQPFLTDAAQDTEPVWLPIFEADMLAAISRVQGK